MVMPTTSIISALNARMIASTIWATYCSKRVGAVSLLAIRTICMVVISCTTAQAQIIVPATIANGVIINLPQYEHSSGSV